MPHNVEYHLSIYLPLCLCVCVRACLSFDSTLCTARYSYDLPHQQPLGNVCVPLRLFFLKNQPSMLVVENRIISHSRSIVNFYFHRMAFTCSPVCQCECFFLLLLLFHRFLPAYLHLYALHQHIFCGLV